MKVTAINQRNRKSDNKEYWEVRLEGDDKPLLMFTKPEFQEGIDLSPESLQLSKNRQYYYLNVKGGMKPQKFSPVKDEDLIMLQVAFKGAVELENCWYVPDGKEHIDRVIENTSLLFANLLLLKPKKKNA